MILEAYSIHDKKAKLYARPFFLQNNAVCIRALTDNIKKDEAMASHADDYAVYKIGTYDDSIGQLLSNEIPELISEMRAIKDVADASKNDPRQLPLPHVPNDQL